MTEASTTQAFVPETSAYRELKRTVAKVGLEAVERALTEEFGEEHVVGVQRIGPLEIMVRLRPRATDYAGGPRYFTFKMAEPI